MNDEIDYKNNPLHGVGLKQLLTEIVDHYGFDILFAYLNINCFKTNPSIKSSLKFLKKTDWAREKVEAFYLYKFKNLPKASADQFELPPRDRIVPQGQIPGEPAELSLEDAERLRAKRSKKAETRSPRTGGGSSLYKGSGSQRKDRDSNIQYTTGKDDIESSDATSTSDKPYPDPWANWKKSKIKRSE